MAEAEEVRNELTLTEENGKTILTLIGKPINCTEEEYKAYEGMRAGMEQGAKRTFDQLKEYVMKLQEEDDYAIIDEQNQQSI